MSDPYVRTRLRRARKSRWCESCDGRAIRPGNHYLEHTELPGGEAGYADAAGHPVRMAECRSCAERYGRGHLFAAQANPTPIEGGAA